MSVHPSVMESGASSGWCLFLFAAGLLQVCLSVGGSPLVAIDGYTSTELIADESVPLGTQIILVCRVVGLPYGTPLSYTWTCPNGPCEVERYYGRKVYNEHILAVNTTSTSDGGTYTCRVTATGGQEATGNFTLRVTGGRVVHSYGRLIPHEFPITDLQQISGPDGIGRINCTVSSGTAEFVRPAAQLQTDGVSQTRNGATATLIVNQSGSFENRDIYCNEITSYFYLFFSGNNPLTVPRLRRRVRGSVVDFQVDRRDTARSRLIAGYTVSRFGMPMVGEYDNVQNGRIITISPAVPGAQYRITAWAIGDDRRSATPIVVDATTGEENPLRPRRVAITTVFENGIELNWLPPTEPNGEVHYAIYYTTEGGIEQSIDTGSNLTHYNLTGLERNRVYTNISVQAVNSVGRSEKSDVIPQYNHTSLNEDTTTEGSATILPTPPTGGITDILSIRRQEAQTVLIAGVVVSLAVAILLLVALVVVVLAVVVVVRRRKRGKRGGVVKERNNTTTDSYYEFDDEETENENSVQNGQASQSMSNSHLADHLLKISEHYEVSSVFINSASSDKSLGINICHNDIHQSAPECWGALEVTSAQWNGAGSCEELSSRDYCDVFPTGINIPGHKDDANSSNAQKKEELNPDLMYAQPDRSKNKGNAREGEGRFEDKPPLPTDMYARPDMAKKKHRRQQKHEGKGGQKKLVPQAFLPYQHYQEHAVERGEDREAAPAPPPPYIPHEEQYYNTRGGAGPPSQERNYDYVVVGPNL